MKSADFVTDLGDMIYKMGCERYAGFPLLTWISCGVPVSGETDICSGGSATLTASGWDTYLWSTDETTSSITVTPTATTTYYVTGTTDDNSELDSITVNVHSDIQITTEVIASSDGEVHGTITPGPVHSVTCGTTTTPIDIATDIGWYINKIVVNGTVVETFDPVDIVTNYSYDLSVEGSTIWKVEVHLDNKYTISSYAYVLNENFEEEIIDAERFQLITPWGTNGVLTVNYPDTTVLRFNETDKYKVVNVEIDGSNYGIIDTFAFSEMTYQSHVKVQYEDGCTIETLPYEQGFTERSLSDCWTTPGSSAPTVDWIYSYKTPRSLTFNAEYNTVLAVMPKLDDLFYLQDVQLSFAFRAGNEIPVLEVGVMTDPNNALTFDRIAMVPITMVNSWEEHTVYFNNYMGDAKYIAFRIPYGSPYTHCLDDVKIDHAPSCLPPSGLEISYVKEASALISWNTPDENYGFIVEYKEADTDNWVTLNTQTNTQVLTGLTVNTHYNVRVLSDCLSDTIKKSFITLCSPGITIGTPEALTDNDGNFLFSNLYYGYSYSQQIYTATEFQNNPMTMKSLAFQYFYVREANRNLSIYLGHTPNSIINTVNDFIPFDDLKQVFKGDVTLNSEGDNFWFSLLLDSTFMYNGVDNLVVAVLDQTNNYVNNSDNKFRTHLTPNGENMAVYYYQDYTSIDPSSPTSVSEKGVSMYRTNIQFPDCNNPSSCVAPNVVETSGVTADQAEISWVNENGYVEMEYKITESSAWETVSGAISPHMLSGLIADTSYEVRVRTVCAPNFSDWVEISFSTEPEPVICDEITIPFTEDFNSYTDSQYPACWARFTSGYENLPYLEKMNDEYNHSIALTFGNTLRSYNVAVLPPFESFIDLSTLQVQFLAKTNSPNNGLFLLGVMDNDSDISTFEVVDTIVNNEAYVWEEKVIALNNYGGSGKYIAFMWQNGAANNIFSIDDLYINTIPACSRPENLVVDSSTTEIIYLSWTQERTVNSWLIEYSSPGFAPGYNQGTQLAVSANESVAISGLLPGTEYEFYVIAECGVTFSEYSHPILCWTKQIPATLPYTCDFEDVSVAQKWSLENGYQKNRWHIGTAANNTPGGNNALYISDDFGVTPRYSNNTSYVYAYRLIHFADAGQYEFSFDWLCNGESVYDHLRVFLVPSDVMLIAGNANGMAEDRTVCPSNWIDITDRTLLYGETTWQNFFTTIGITTPGDYYLTFFWKNDGNTDHQSPAQVDNIHVNKFTCPAPVDMVFSSVGATNATLTWTEQGSAAEWEIVYVSAGNSVSFGISHIATGTPVITLSGLSSSTDYDVYVRAICGPGDTSRWVTRSLLTGCSILEMADLPLQENFDRWPIGSSNETSMPRCWKTLISDFVLNNHPYITNESSATYSSPNSLSFNTTSNSYNMVILPEFGSSINISNLEIEFMTKTFNRSNGDLILGVISNPLNAASFIPVDTIIVRASNQFEPIIRTFANYQGTGHYLAIMWQNGGAENTYFLDDLVVRVHNPSDLCEPPADLQANNVASTTASVSWSGGAEWEFRYKKTTDSFFRKQIRLSSATYSLTGLAGNTSYDVQVRTVCANGRVSEWLTTSFTTANVEHTIIATAGPNGEIFPSGEVVVAKGSTPIFTFIPHTGYEVQSVQIDGIDVIPSTEYTFSPVMANATIHVEFKTVGLSTFNPDQMISVYPNPVKNNLNVKTETLFESLEITNIMGQIVHTAIVTHEEFSIDVSSYGPGIYFIRMKGKQGLITKKFIKE